MVNRGFCPSVGFKYGLDCSCLRRDVLDSCLRYPGGHEGHMSPGRAEMSTSLPARPCAAPPRPARGMSGFWTRQVGSHRFPGCALHNSFQDKKASVRKLFCTQEHSALLVPLISPLSAGGFDPSSVYIRFPLFVLPKWP